MKLETRALTGARFAYTDDSMSDAPSRSASVSTLVSALIDEAHGARASDIHLDPTPAALRVRLRIDGRLAERRELPATLQAEIISRLKIISGLRTDEHRRPQDGRFRHTLPDGSALDVRLCIMPTYHGENAVLRLLAQGESPDTLASLGFEAPDAQRIVSTIHSGEGLVLVTGPTGSGKTTTLYALLSLLNEPHRSLVTVEDPIEYAIGGVRQVQVQHESGFGFAEGLRAVLRQDPDILMVGEIRDRETASIAANVALTGHLVLSSLHTTDAARAAIRLLDMGIEPYLLAYVLRLIVAQRLVRVLCTACHGTACGSCAGSGYSGRTVFAEVLVPNEQFRGAVRAKRDAQTLTDLARGSGMRTLKEAGKALVEAGRTRGEEIAAVAHV